MNKSVYCIGVGGIGISALARYLHAQGYAIYGADPSDNEIVQSLREDIGAIVYTEHNASQVPEDCEAVVYSPAVDESNPERVRAREIGIKEYSYPEYLGLISQGKKTIAVAGTNGKTTTTSMIATLLDECGHDPTVIVGGIIPRFGSNFSLGKSELFVVEACEYRESFLHLEPEIAVITNITADHLAYFGTVDKYIDAFVAFVDRMREGGTLITNPALPHLERVVARARGRGLKIVDYTQATQAPWSLPVPGQYNIDNANTAVSVGVLVRIPADEAQYIIQYQFQTTARRFELLGLTPQGAMVYDDYAHNTEALKLLLQGVRERFSDKKIVLVFQHHLYSRTQDFYDDWVEALALTDVVYLLPIYPARERAEDFSVRSEDMINDLTQEYPQVETHYLADISSGFIELESHNYASDTIIITAGAGIANHLGRKLVQ